MERVLEVGKTYRMKFGTTYTVIKRWQDEHKNWWVETDRGARWAESLADGDKEVKYLYLWELPDGSTLGSAGAWPEPQPFDGTEPGRWVRYSAVRDDEGQS